jgi:hypothetical protein
MQPRVPSMPASAAPRAMEIIGARPEPPATQTMSRGDSVRR